MFCGARHASLAASRTAITSPGATSTRFRIASNEISKVLASRISTDLETYVDGAAEFWYVDRLKSEIGTYPDGRADVHEHPLEPIMARFTISKQFGL